MNPPLTTDEQRRAAELFEAVVALPPAERSAHLAGVEDRIRQEVESLLLSAAQSADYLAEPIVQPRRMAPGSRLGVWRLDEVIG